MQVTVCKLGEYSTDDWDTELEMAYNFPSRGAKHWGRQRYFIQLIGLPTTARTTTHLLHLLISNYFPLFYIYDTRTYVTRHDA